MWKFVKAVSGNIVVAIVLTGIVSAHHSMAEFENAKDITVEGVISEIKWVNPHGTVFVDAVTINGQAVKAQNWGAETASPSALAPRGLTRNSLKVGDKVTISGPARRDGAPLMLLREITLPDGKRIALRLPVGAG